MPIQLKEIKLPKNISLIGRNAFSDNKIEHLVIPPNVKRIHSLSFSVNPLKSIVYTNKEINEGYQPRIDSDNLLVFSFSENINRDNFNLDKDKLTLYQLNEDNVLVNDLNQEEIHLNDNCEAVENYFMKDGLFLESKSKHLELYKKLIQQNFNKKDPTSLG